MIISAGETKSSMTGGRHNPLNLSSYRSGKDRPRRNLFDLARHLQGAFSMLFKEKHSSVANFFRVWS